LAITSGDLENHQKKYAQRVWTSGKGNNSSQIKKWATGGGGGGGGGGDEKRSKTCNQKKLWGATSPLLQTLKKKGQEGNRKGFGGSDNGTRGVKKKRDRELTRPGARLNTARQQGEI